jgi:hypothetical protein
MKPLLISLNFWEYKQLEYWLKDNFPDCTIRSMYDKFTGPDEEDWYTVEGDITVDLRCLIVLKYGNKLKGSNSGNYRYGQN